MNRHTKRIRSYECIVWKTICNNCIMQCHLYYKNMAPSMCTQRVKICSCRCIVLLQLDILNPLITIISEIEKCMPIIAHIMSELPHWTYVLPVGRDSEPMAYAFTTNNKEQNLEKNSQ